MFYKKLVNTQIKAFSESDLLIMLARGFVLYMLCLILLLIKADISFMLRIVKQIT